MVSQGFSQFKTDPAEGAPTDFSSRCLIDCSRSLCARAWQGHTATLVGKKMIVYGGVDANSGKCQGNLLLFDTGTPLDEVV